MSVAPVFSSVSAVTALTASGTSDSASLRRVAVTTMSPVSTASPAALALIDRAGFGGGAVGRLGGALVGVGLLGESRRRDANRPAESSQMDLRMKEPLTWARAPSASAGLPCADAASTLAISASRLHALEHRHAELAVRHLAAAEAHGDLHLVAFAEELDDLLHLGVVIVVVDVRTHLDLLDLLRLLALALRVGLLLRLVFEAADVEELGDGRIGVGEISTRSRPTLPRPARSLRAVTSRPDSRHSRRSPAPSGSG
jgi:hypothetical protein